MQEVLNRFHNEGDAKVFHPLEEFLGLQMIVNLQNYAAALPVGEREDTLRKLGLHSNADIDFLNVIRQQEAALEVFKTSKLEKKRSYLLSFNSTAKNKMSTINTETFVKDHVRFRSSISSTSSKTRVTAEQTI